MTATQYKELAGSELSTPKDIVHFIRSEHGLSISYQKAWRACEVALDDIHESPKDSYKMLPRFAYILKLNNPIISIDGTSLKNKYGGTLLSASTTDANDQIFPLALCVVDSENDSPLIWFWNQLKRIIGGRNEVVIISDRHKSICKAIEIVFPDVLHCICLVHLLRNLKLKYKRIMDIVFHSCGKAFNIVDFKHKMRLLESSAPGIREELESIGFAKWSHAYSPRRRYNVMTTNISESLNSTMLKARELSICSMLELYPINNMKYQVIDGSSQYVIYLFTKVCSYRMWDTLEIPCVHACAVFTMKHLSIKSYVSLVYLNSTLSSIYRGVINPLGDHRQWQIPDDIMSIVILPPNVKRVVGRPKKIKIPSRMEFKRCVKCGRCRHVGHNRKRCKFFLLN
ncbi:uncharacterized protein LOC127149731 [Cucumis melo]|uniref:Uncharacterized protein LOC127149731 n=1 Tax=Cucumis melo TaxID=3656 RepID=A0ABM3KUU4_CUCME|nr:uncharacterized protein LOC127149731 [Cucumis melo]